MQSLKRVCNLFLSLSTSYVFRAVWNFWKISIDLVRSGPVRNSFLRVTEYARTVCVETRERNTRESRKRKKEERAGEHTRVPREPTHTHTRHRVHDRNGEIIAARTLPIAYVYTILRITRSRSADRQPKDADT